jgi:hypothetical protein
VNSGRRTRYVRIRPGLKGSGGKAAGVTMFPKDCNRMGYSLSDTPNRRSGWVEADWRVGAIGGEAIAVGKYERAQGSRFDC